MSIGTTYVFMVASDADALSLSIECTFDMATLALDLQVSRNLFRQGGDLCECVWADIAAFEQVRLDVALKDVRGEGEGCPSE